MIASLKRFVEVALFGAVAISAIIAFSLCGGCNRQTQEIEKVAEVAPKQELKKELIQASDSDKAIFSEGSTELAALESFRLEQEGGTTTKKNSGKRSAADVSQTEKVVQTVDTNNGKWDYSTDTDAMTSKITRTAHITAENSFSFPFPYEGESYGRLMIRHRASDGLSVLFSITKGQLVCMQSCSINVRFDDKPAMRFTASRPADYSSTSVFLSPESKFVSELKRSKRVLIETTYYSAGSRVSEFKTGGFKWEEKAQARKERGISPSVFLCTDSTGKKEYIENITYLKRGSPKECNKVALPAVR